MSPQVQEKLAVSVEDEEQFSNAANIPPLTTGDLSVLLASGGFVRELTSYQRDNVRQLARLKAGATFSVPGAGKTTEALAFFAAKATSESKLLVVAPKNAFAAWEEQLEICIPESPRFIRLGAGRKGVAQALAARPVRMLITYQLFPNVYDILGSYLAEGDSFFFLDESHRIKGGAQKVIASAILDAATVASKRLVLSGTPLPNAIVDLIPQIKFVAPELIIDENNVEELANPLYVRTTKGQLNLPDVSIKYISVPMAPAQRKLYELMRSEAARQANTLLLSKQRNAIRRIGRSAIRLLQFTSNPALLARKEFEYDGLLSDVLEEGDSAKLALACLQARKLAYAGLKSIIWSSFVENVELIAERLIDLGADYIHGGVEASSDLEEDSRERKIARFHNDSKAMVLVANPAACSEGISLHTVCKNAIYVDRNYNAAQFIQSQDRIHRIGSKDPVTVTILVSPDTIDESVGRRLEQKVNTMARVLNDPHLRIDPISFDADLVDPDDADVEDMLRHLHVSVPAA